MGERRHAPTDVIPGDLAAAVDQLPGWFLIGGHAVRCTSPYRPTRDVDFGVGSAGELDALLARLSDTGTCTLHERTADTAHLAWNGLGVSVFVVPFLLPYVTERCLDATAIMATKVHAIVDRGARRDFFDLYVILQQHRLGVLECLTAIRRVYGQDVDDGLLLRALTYFDDADREAPLPGEGPDDWPAVKEFFMDSAARLLLPPGPELDIQSRRVDVRDGPLS